MSHRVDVCSVAWVLFGLRGVLRLRLSVQLAVCALLRLRVWSGVSCRLVHVARVAYCLLACFVCCDVRYWRSDVVVCFVAFVYIAVTVGVSSYELHRVSRTQVAGRLDPC